MTQELINEEKPVDITPLDPIEAYNEGIEKVVSIQHRIDDTATLAAEKIGKLKNYLDHLMNVYKPFFEIVGKQKAKTNRTTGEKDQHHKDMMIGGGVFFVKGSKSITFDRTPEKLLDLRNILTPEQQEAFIEEKWNVKKGAELRLLKVLAQHDQDFDCTEFYDDKENNDSKFGYGKLADHFILNVNIPEETLKVGVSKGWTPNAAKTKLTAAIEGKLQAEVINDDDEQ